MTSSIDSTLLAPISENPKHESSSVFITPPESIRQLQRSKVEPTVRLGAKKDHHDHDTFPKSKPWTRSQGKHTDPSGRGRDAPGSTTSLAEDDIFNDPGSSVKRKLELDLSLDSPSEPLQMLKNRKENPKHESSSVFITPPKSIRQLQRSKVEPTVRLRAKKDHHDHDTFLKSKPWTRSQGKHTDPSGRGRDTPGSTTSLAEDDTSTDPGSSVKRKLELDLPLDSPSEPLQMLKNRKPSSWHLPRHLPRVPDTKRVKRKNPKETSLLSVENKAGYTPVGMALTEDMKEAIPGQRLEVSGSPAVEEENQNRSAIPKLPSEKDDASVPPVSPGRIIDKLLLRIAKLVPMDKIFELGTALNIDFAQIERYSAKNNDSGSSKFEGTLKMLQDWNLQHEGNVKPDLVSALKEAKMSKLIIRLKLNTP